jgi:hypothetical protein
MDKPILSGHVEWTGENPGLYLKAGGQYTCLASPFRVLHSPHGAGHATFLLSDPAGVGRSDGPGNVCVTDNPPLAHWLLDTFVRNYPHFRGNATLANLVWIDGSSFERHGDTRTSYGERIVAPNLTIDLAWTDLQEPSMITLARELAPTGRHALFAVLIPAQNASVTINGRRLPGEPFEWRFHDRDISSAYLTWSETWVAID